MYLLNRNGKEVRAINENGNNYVVAPNQMLIWNVDDNQMVVKGNNIARNTNNIVLLSNSHGVIQNGFFKPWYDDYILQSQIDLINTKSVTIPYDKITKLSSTGSSQWLTIVNNEIWGFNVSADDHSSYETIKRYDIDTFKLKNDFTHNLGHSASADYNTIINTLIVGNRTSDETVLPGLDVIKNASSLCGNETKKIEYGNKYVNTIFYRK